MHRDARALDLCPCITRDVPYDARMMHRDALMRLMHLGLGDAWCIKPRSLYVIGPVHILVKGLQALQEFVGLHTSQTRLLPCLGHLSVLRVLRTEAEHHARRHAQQATAYR